VSYISFWKKKNPNPNQGKDKNIFKKLKKKKKIMKEATPLGQWGWLATLILANEGCRQPRF
jgi:hypothetical protein